MPVSASNVLIGAPAQKTTGAIICAPRGTMTPKTARDEIKGTGVEDSGYISEDGLTLTPEYSTSDINDWSGALVRRILESFNGTLLVEPWSLATQQGGPYKVFTPFW